MSGLHTPNIPNGIPEVAEVAADVVAMILSQDDNQEYTDTDNEDRDWKLTDQIHTRCGSDTKSSKYVPRLFVERAE